MVVKKNCHRLRPFSLERRRRQWECADFNSYYESLCSASSFCLVRTDIFVVLLFKFFFLVLSDRFLVQLDLCVLDISKPPSHANRKKSAAAINNLKFIGNIYGNNRGRGAYRERDSNPFARGPLPPSMTSLMDERGRHRRPRQWTHRGKGTYRAASTINDLING